MTDMDDKAPPEKPSETSSDPLDDIEAYNRGVVLGLVKRFLHDMSAGMDEKNAARGLKLVEQVCENQRNLLTILGGAAPMGKKRRSLLMPNPMAEYSDDIASALGASEPDGETFGAQAIKSIMDTITSALGTINKPSAGPGRDRQKKDEIALAEAGLRAANLLGDNDLIASRRAVLRELLKSEDYVDGAGAFETEAKARHEPLVMPPPQPTGEHVRKEDWHHAHDVESDESIHPCDNWWWQDCMCEGACSCHWVQPTEEKKP